MASPVGRGAGPDGGAPLDRAALTRAAVPESAYASLRWRLVGPLRGGWATVVAGVPGDPATFYFGAADGGVWRTRDAGITWRPLFDAQGSASLGALAIAPRVGCESITGIWAPGDRNRCWDACSTR